MAIHAVLWIPTGLGAYITPARGFRTNVAFYELDKNEHTEKEAEQQRLHPTNIFNQPISTKANALKSPDRPRHKYDQLLNICVSCQVRSAWPKSKHNCWTYLFELYFTFSLIKPIVSKPTFRYDKTSRGYALLIQVPFHARLSHWFIHTPLRTSGLYS